MVLLNLSNYRGTRGCRWCRARLNVDVSIMSDYKRCKCPN
jgi:hypothetical protein